MNRMELLKVGLGSDVIQVFESTIKTGIIIESALLGRRPRGNAALHEQLGVEDPLGENVLIDGDVCITLEFVQKGIFADEKLGGKVIEGHRLRDMVIDIADHFADAFMALRTDRIPCLDNTAYIGCEDIHAQALQFLGKRIFLALFPDKSIDQTNDQISGLFADVVAVILPVHGFFQNIEQMDPFIGKVVESLPRNIKVGAFIGLAGIEHIGAVECAGRKNEEIHGPGIKKFILNDSIILLKVVLSPHSLLFHYVCHESSGHAHELFWGFLFYSFCLLFYHYVQKA